MTILKLLELQLFQVEKNRRLNSIFSIVSILRDQIHSLVVRRRSSVTTSVAPRIGSAGATAKTVTSEQNVDAGKSFIQWEIIIG